MPRVRKSSLQSPTPAQRAGDSKADLVLMSFVIIVIVLLVVPVPTVILDLLLSASLSLSALVLFTILLSKKTVSIGIFPSILLLMTLFRLSLTISSTRLILLQGDAGTIIRSFGQYVVKGNTLVGLVIFCLLALVQFVVIAKGSERIAEVAARFSLDALPGRQLAIDTELRSGTINATKASQKRAELAKESQFYGAMDGAMKFVKGDVLATFLCTMVALAGGLLVGVTQRNLSVETAMKKYALLAIGDGLVSQIPAIFLSMAAGFLVTQGAHEETRTISDDLRIYLLTNRKALLGAAIFVSLLGLAPGLPLIPFLLLGAILFFMARRPKLLQKSEDVLASDLTEVPTRTVRAPLPLRAWGIDVGSRTFPDVRVVVEAMNGVVDRIYASCGVLLSMPYVHVDNAKNTYEFTIRMREVPISNGELHGSPSERLHQLSERVESEMRKHVHELVGISETQALLDELKADHPALVEQLIPKVFSVRVLSEVLKRLLEEQVSIRDLRTILEGIAPLAESAQTSERLLEHARIALKHSMSYALSAKSDTIFLFAVDPLLEDTIRSAVTPTGRGQVLALAPSLAREIIGSIQALIQKHEQELNGRPCVLLVAPDIRFVTSQFVRHAIPNCFVLTHTEVHHSFKLRTLACVAPS